MNIKTETKTYEISYDNLEAALLQFLQANRLIPLDYDILEVDIGVPVTKKGTVEFDITYAIPEKTDKKRPHLRVIENENQLSLFNV